jgi:hypothetical protein
VDLAAAGFDIAHAWQGGLLIGNTRALWAPFSAARRDEPDALDRYTERCVSAAFPGATIEYAHEQPFKPFQRYAVEAGLAALTPTMLLVHPVYGPWFALRALIVRPGPARLPIAKPCVCTQKCDQAFAEAHDGPSWLAVRDACSTGRAWRYSDEQIRYHYTRSLLSR